MTITLRQYQRNAVDSIFNYYANGGTGNPLVVAPTGSGKSVLIGKFIEEVCANWPNQRILMLAHRKELLQQNASKIIKCYPNASLGIYSAGLNSRQLGRKITVAGIQSVYNKADKIGWQDLLLIDEAHLLPPDGEGMYQTLIKGLKEFNPNLKIIGFTATPYRLKTGLLTDKGGIFTDICCEIQMSELIKNGYLAPLISKAPKTQADLSDVRIAGGEYVAAQAEKAMDDAELTEAAIAEMKEYGEGRHHWLIFAAGVDHANHVAEALRRHGYTAEAVVGDTPPMFRESYIAAFREGRLQCLVNCEVLTTGFDSPNMDMLVLLRPTQSVGLYVQMVGRGSRISPDTGKIDCLVLDFAGNIERHGPVDAVRVRRKGGSDDKGVSTAPTKICPACRNGIPLAVTACPFCGHEFDEKPAHNKAASTAAILAAQVKPETLSVVTVDVKRHSKEGKPDSLKVSYICEVPDQIKAKYVSEWICLEHEGFARQKAVRWWVEHHVEYTGPASIEDLVPRVPDTITDALDLFPRAIKKVSEIQVRVENGFDRVVGYTYLPFDPTEETEEDTDNELFDKYGVNL